MDLLTFLIDTVPRTVRTDEYDPFAWTGMSARLEINKHFLSSVQGVRIPLDRDQYRVGILDGCLPCVVLSVVAGIEHEQSASTMQNIDKLIDVRLTQGTMSLTVMVTSSRRCHDGNSTIRLPRNPRIKIAL